MCQQELIKYPTRKHEVDQPFEPLKGHGSIFFASLLVVEKVKTVSLAELGIKQPLP